jgi:hypothetical protein
MYKGLGSAGGAVEVVRHSIDSHVEVEAENQRMALAIRKVGHDGPHIFEFGIEGLSVDLRSTAQFHFPSSMVSCDAIDHGSTQIGAGVP